MAAVLTFHFHKGEDILLVSCIKLLVIVQDHPFLTVKGFEFPDIFRCIDIIKKA